MGKHSEIKTFYEGKRKESKERKEKNKLYGLRRLSEVGIPYELRNGGYHAIVRKGRVRFDYWPSTGLWREQNSNRQGRGIDSLVKTFDNRCQQEFNRSQERRSYK